MSRSRLLQLLASELNNNSDSLRFRFDGENHDRIMVPNSIRELVLAMPEVVEIDGKLLNFGLTSIRRYNAESG